jgi:hypothetical protein
MIQAERTGRKQERRIMCKEDDNKAIVGRWFKDFWSTPSDLTVVDELAAPDVLLQYSPDTPRRGRDAVRAFRASLSIGSETGPHIGVQSGPRGAACAGSPKGGPARCGVPVQEADAAARGGCLWTHRCKPR